jgi:transposase
MSVATFVIGIDLGNEKHSICIIAADGRVVKERVVDNDATALRVIMDQIGHCPPQSVDVAVEDMRVALVDALLGYGFNVFTLNPKQLDRFRDRTSISGAKDDRRDAFVLASSLRSDRNLFRQAELLSPELVVLQGLNASISALEQGQRRHTNQLRALVLRYFPALLALCAGTDEPWFWDLLELLRSPEHAKTVEEVRVQQVLKTHRKRKLTVATIREVIERAHFKTAPGVDDACIPAACRLMSILRAGAGAIDAACKERACLLRTLAVTKDKATDVEVLMSMPGVGERTAAVLLVDAGHVLRDERALRGLAGIAPVTKQSGKTRHVVMRRACSNRLREALHHAVSSAVRWEPRFKRHYARLRAAGHNHARALRGVADGWLRVLGAMMRRGTPFERGTDLEGVPAASA